jgi:FMN-dependent NADH-azoreductase
MRVLHIDSSIQGEASASRVLTRAILGQLQAGHPGIAVIYRDLAAAELPHLSQAVLAQQDATALEEFLAADAIVIGAPIYNFGLPSQLKAWIDRITVAGKTFRYTASGPEGLARGKKVIVALTRGESYLRFLFGFLGIDDVSFVRAQGLAISPQQRASALEAALASIRVPVQQAA